MSEYHVPVLLKESVDGLDINPTGTYVDVTFGGGGHSREILSRLSDGGKLVSFDQDADAEKNAQEAEFADNDKFIFVRHNFKYIKNFLRYYNIYEVDGIIADLGVSSHQFDTAERGFSFRFDSLLDMRMNTGSKLSAKDIINTYDETKLRNMFRNYGEIKNAGRLAKTLVSERANNKIKTSGQLLEIAKQLTPKYQENKYMAKLFQALRIEVNCEVELLKEFLQRTNSVLCDNGRLVVITYHSLEDRVVKNFTRTGNFEGKVEQDIYGNIIAPFEQINRKVIIPNAEEIETNNRARSAKLRIAKKIK